MPNEHLSLLRQADGARTPQNQRGSDAPLEHGDHSAQTGLAQVQPLRRTTIVPLLAEHEKTTNGAKIQIHVMAEGLVFARNRPG